MTETLERIAGLTYGSMFEDSEVEEGTPCVVSLPKQCQNTAAFKVAGRDGLPFCQEHGEEYLAGLLCSLHVNAKETLWEKRAFGSSVVGVDVNDLYPETLWEDAERVKEAAGGPLARAWDRLGLDQYDPPRWNYILVCELMYTADNRRCEKAMWTLEPLRQQLASRLKECLSDRQ